MMISRRDFVKMGLVAGAASALPLHRSLGLLDAEAKPFTVPLHVPPVLKPVRRDAKRDYYELTLRKAGKEIIPGKRTTIWGFNGRFPGPTIKVDRGRPVVVRQINRLNVNATIHLHGGHVSPENDGHPMDFIPPGKHRDYHYPNKQRASTLWYHDHTHGHTSRNIYMGLAGLYLISDGFERSLNLPKGKYDIPLVIQDRAFTRDGRFKFPNHHRDVLGGTYLVNGRPTPRLEVANRKYRFRIVNASNSRDYLLALDPGIPMTQIASDGGLLPASFVTPNLTLWPAERAEVVIDFSHCPEGSRVVLVDRADAATPLEGKPVMCFDVVRQAEDDSELPAVLRPIEQLEPGNVKRTFRLSLNDRNRWVINGKTFGHNRVDARPKLGSTEEWTFNNISTVVHPMHVHLVMFQILDRDGVPPAPGEAGWKDTVRVESGERVRVAARFTDHPGRYVFHCHNLVHEDHSMMGQFEVIR